MIQFNFFFLNQITVSRSNFSRLYLNFKLIIFVLILTLSGSYETSKISCGSLAQAAKVIYRVYWLHMPRVNNGRRPKKYHYFGHFS